MQLRLLRPSTLLLLCLTARAVLGNFNALDSLKHPGEGHDPSLAEVTDRLTLSITIGGEPAGHVVVGVFGDVVPRTAANFKALCVGTPDLSFVGSPFHRTIKQFMIQGGDITRGDGRGGSSIYGSSFADENFQLHHTVAGVLSMANSGPDSNGSQFFITTIPTPHLDGKHVVFGRVLSGMDVVTRIEHSETGPGDRPLLDVLISDCTHVQGGQVADWEARVYGTM